MGTPRLANPIEAYIVRVIRRDERRRSAASERRMRALIPMANGSWIIDPEYEDDLPAGYLDRYVMDSPDD
jgi:hypothetical protein